MINSFRYGSIRTPWARAVCLATGLLATGLAYVAVLGVASSAVAQATTTGSGAAAGATVSPNDLAPGSPYRKLAPGVMLKIDPTRKASEAVEPQKNITELLYVDPNFDFAKDVNVRHDVWMLEIECKPIRMIWADVPGPRLQLRRKQIWYLVYKITNPGKIYHPVETDDKTFKLVYEDRPLQFVPLLTLEVHSRLQDEATASGKVYTEKYMPIVIPAIRAREDKNREFLSSFDMPKREIAVGKSVWGVATWEDIDPENVWFSVTVEGLTNATMYKDDPAKYAAKQSGTSREAYREIFTKVLKINFWRPGDEFNINEKQVRPGLPALTKSSTGSPLYEWVWRRIYPAS